MALTHRVALPTADGAQRGLGRTPGLGQGLRWTEHMLSWSNKKLVVTSALLVVTRSY